MSFRDRPFPSEGYTHDKKYQDFDIYTESHLHQASQNPYHDALEHAFNNACAKGLPAISVSAQLGKFLCLQARLVNAKNILELGTLGGYSAIWMASSSPDVRITSVEIDPHHKEVAEENFAYAGVQDRVDVKLGPGVEVLPLLIDEVKSGKRPAFDMVFIDADKLSNLAYVELALEMTRSGAVIVVDNVVRRGRTMDESLAATDDGVRGARMLIEGVGKIDRLDATVMQTLSGYSYDGFLIAAVK